MKNRKIYVLIVVLGLAMVWLGFLYTYELKIADRSIPSTEQQAVGLSNSLQQEKEQAQTAGIEGGDVLNETGTGFPLILAGLGFIFVIAGVKSFRQQG